MKRLVVKYALVALSAMGSAILLYSCDSSSKSDDDAADDMMMTEYMENLSVVMSQNGQRSYYFETPLAEGYTLAREPFREFRKGVKITTYQDDSLSTVNAVLTANYAIYYINRDLWEAKGNVVVERADGKCLYTQQLFWNRRSHRIYSNVDSKFVEAAGRSALVGEGFDSDDEFKLWHLRRPTGYLEVDVTPSERADSTAVAEPVAGDSVDNSAPQAPAPAPESPAPRRQPEVEKWKLQPAEPEALKISEPAELKIE